MFFFIILAPGCDRCLDHTMARMFILRRFYHGFRTTTNKNISSVELFKSLVCDAGHKLHDIFSDLPYLPIKRKIFRIDRGFYKKYFAFLIYF